MVSSRQFQCLDTSTANWNDDPNGYGNQFYWYSDGYSAVFGSGGDTTGDVVQVGTDYVSFDSIEFAPSAGNYEIDSQYGFLATSDSGTGTITVDDGCSATITCSIFGNYGLTKDGDGTLTLTGWNGYYGPTTISQGTLAFGSGSLDNSSAIVFDGGALQWYNNNEDVSGWFSIDDGQTAILDTGGNDVTLETAITGDGGLQKIGDGTLTLNATNAYSGDTTISQGTLAFADGALDCSNSIIFDGGALQWASGNNEDVSGSFAAIESGQMAILDTGGNPVTLGTALSGSGGLEKLGDGTLTLSSSTPSSFTGATIVSAGTLQLGASDALPSATAVTIADTGGATFDINGYSQAIGSLQGGGTSGGSVALGSGTLMLGDPTSTTYSGSLSGTSAGNFVKQALAHWLLPVATAAIAARSSSTPAC